MTDAQPRARVSMSIAASPRAVYDAFIEPGSLTQFWLSSAAGPLRIGEEVDWHFMVAGATVKTTATRLDPGKRIEWRWSDGSTVSIELEPFEGGTAVTIVNAGFAGVHAAQIEAALNATEGFSIVLCDLKTLLESGRSAGLTRGKARLIERVR